MNTEIRAAAIGDSVAGYERDRRGATIFAGEHDEICRAHTARAHADAQLA
jgi:hypothetical protein